VEVLPCGSRGLAAVKALETHRYPAGDIRNEPAFWIALTAGAVILVGVLLLGSIRLLLRDDSATPTPLSRDD
jgi:hypothetical protein